MTGNLNDSLAEAAAFMRERDDFLVVSHVQPDGDAAASTCAVGWMLHALGKTFTMINEGPLPQRFRYLWGADRVLSFADEPPQRTFANIIAIDCADYARIGNVRSLFASDAAIVNIDHHPTNDGFGQINVLKFDAAATVELLYDLHETLELPRTIEFATSIYTGLLTDTGGFRYSNTTPKVMQISTALLDVGVKGHELAEHILETVTFAHIQLLKKALVTLSFAQENRIAWMYVTAADIAETQAASDDLEGLVNYPRNIEGVQVGLLFKQYDSQTVKVSFRSAGEIDVAGIAKEMGGGGHRKAAGCTLQGSLEEAIGQVVARLRREWT